ncbi:Predicted transcriptional regulator, contains HTH domain [Halobiforma haloterrestris]|uniref:Predicted transcriptional regulator, contains HTH domain n=1 Tax=Natronobacterium haloterrestre TaxID=148448 RepID=A0A1I1CZJ0_NATHA|nr:hypothetical protein [Halobiforma haloterrestris]SFB67522.1 Predicted transcriptional regulator, contains HTH domain [Halobiforma haloterrestris]
MNASNSEFREVVSKRDEILASLFNSPKTKPELVSTIGKSRSTINRAIDSLTENHCVKRTEDGAYCVTQTGNLALRTHQEFKDRMGTLSNSDDIINAISPQFELGYEFLKGVKTLEAEDGVPELALSKSNEIISGSDEFRGLVGVWFSSYPEILLSEVKENDLELEIVTNAELIESLYQINEDPISELLLHENTTILAAECEIPESVWLTDGPSGKHSGITVHSRGGIIGVLINNRQSSVQWVEEIYSEYKGMATQELTVADFNTS